jgi:hypothetical protein
MEMELPQKGTLCLNVATVRYGSLTNGACIRLISFVLRPVYGAGMGEKANYMPGESLG